MGANLPYLGIDLGPHAHKNGGRLAVSARDCEILEEVGGDASKGHTLR